jgi:hypothetical protein
MKSSWVLAGSEALQNQGVCGALSADEVKQNLPHFVVW